MSHYDVTTTFFAVLRSLGVKTIKIPHRF